MSYEYQKIKEQAPQPMDTVLPEPTYPITDMVPSTPPVEEDPAFVQAMLDVEAAEQRGRYVTYGLFALGALVVAYLLLKG